MAVRKRKRAPKVVATNSAYIDPLGCDSTISYKVIDGSMRVYGTVQLADCSRKIEWHFGNEPLSVAKITNAIDLLDEFRTALIEAQYARKRTKRRKRNAATV